MRGHKRMQLLVFMMIAYTSGSCIDGISCFKCTIAPPPNSRNKTSQICSKFEENAHFQVFCPKSTFCMKRTIHHKLVNGTIVQTSSERGCAPQRDLFKAYDFADQIWRDREEVREEVYEEGCFIGEDRGGPGGPPEYCFCRYHLCNGSLTLNGKFYTHGIIISILIIIIHYSMVS